MHRFGRTNPLFLLLSGATIVVILLATLLSLNGRRRAQDSKRLAVKCAAGLRIPMEEIAKNYEEEYGVHVEFDFQGSNTLLNQMQTNSFDTSDLYMAADDFYTKKARDIGLASEELPLAHMRPVIAVRKGNREITSFADLLKPGVRVSIADPDQAAIGRAIKRLLEPLKVGDTNRWEQLNEQVTKSGVYKPTVNDVASDVMLGTNIDAGIVYDATAAMPEMVKALDAISVPELDGDPNLVSITVLNSSPHPTAALRFARYVAARDRGLPILKKYGLRPVEGDTWAETPKITFYCGAVNLRAVEPIIADFMQREGVEIVTNFDGCGILTSKMKAMGDQTAASGFPDVYLACDVYYLENVKEWFQEAQNVSDVELVIVVPKGSEKVTQLSDLIKPGVRVAIGEPNQCTIGALTRRLLANEGLYDALMEKQADHSEVVVPKSSSATLVPDVATGQVDATVAYMTDAMANSDKVDILRIESPLNKATQPFSISRNSEFKHLVRRLYQQIASSPDAFETAGFHFRLGSNSTSKPEPGKQ